MKEGLEYFPLVCNQGEKLDLIEADFGIIGFAVIVKLFQRIYGEKGYYCKWNDDVALLFSARCGLQGRNVVSEVVKCALRRNLFDRGLYEKYGILTSEGIQERYFEAAKRRVSVEVESCYLLLSDAKIPKNVVINEKNADRNAKNVCRNGQRKVEESKGKESKEKKNSAEPQAASAPACPRPPAAELLLNDGTVYAVSAEELAEWAGTYPAVDVAQEFREMAAWLKNNPAKRKTRRGIKRFIMNWLGAEQDKGNPPQAAQPQPKKQNRFINYTQSEWDFNELERFEREKRNSSGMSDEEWEALMERRRCRKQESADGEVCEALQRRRKLAGMDG